MCSEIYVGKKLLIFRMETESNSISNQKNESKPSYNWKDVTPEFFDSIKGNIIIIVLQTKYINIFVGSFPFYATI